MLTRENWGRIGLESNKDSNIEIGIEEQGILETDSNIIYYYSDVDTESVLRLNRELKTIDNQNVFRQITRRTKEIEPIELRIKSFGGEVFAGFAAVDEILKCKSPVHSIIDGCAASAATIMSVVATKRYMNKHAMFLIHQLSSGMWGKFADLEDEMKNLKVIMEMLKDIYKQYTKIPMKKLNEILKHDIWFTAKECLEYGLIDEII